MTSRGVVYCVTNRDAYLEAALISAIALRELEPELPITIISELPLLKFLPLSKFNICSRYLFPQEIICSSNFASRCLKTRLISLSPYQETLFLDADILPRQPLGELWRYLSQTDLALAHDRLPTVGLCDHIASEEKAYTLKRVPSHFTQFNSGVMLWRNTVSTQKLFEQWYQEWLVFQKHDQLALVRALHVTQTVVTRLPKSYNVSPIDSVALIQEGQKVHLLHCWGGMVSSGEFRQMAQKYYPEVVETVDGLYRSLEVWSKVPTIL